MGKEFRSSGVIKEDNEAFLSRNSHFDQGILISTQSYLGEGFDDPKINAVVVTYKTESIIYLMQAAGRALRSTSNKDSAFIVQVRESNIQYHFNEEWLYQDISDSLRPKVEHITYFDSLDLQEKVKNLLEQHNVEEDSLRILKNFTDNHAEKFRLMFSGRILKADRTLRFRCENGGQCSLVPMTLRFLIRIVRALIIRTIVMIGSKDME